ncbi:lysozyme inhibitor LprI family protein [Kingella negevensis]|uniref:lysozyme inhibitor LprI family protein n=1 Tax=Kingella negevensis TaxID=1522312 RepID=UPI00254D68BC|nr:lysozyme inhibitor LprI family protein [Kingella negevensis]MDK4679738.1 lysozyme inhibitor LprI family protein [Kingella negevensis]MDK4682544.1 lysozyme inhibitor LprI family protein [Kingella negevensis]MDK4690740.1 lysozyme inhibitor LprI family protein [Kingella negevensis]MDK4694112.1 lysozyme inhibitor LprI family protein [Kingella negevensis]MDK4699841.1 lysozyme inhibitor LprI family protein [Kingella negevensis]
MLKTVLLSALVALPLSAQAVPETSHDCMDVQTYQDINECKNDEYKTEDDRLNRVYKKLMAKLADQPYKQKQLREAQRA